MSAAVGVTVQLAVTAPPFQAALAITGPAWRSRLVHDGQVQLSEPEVHIGGLSNNDVALSDPKASRLHAAIRWTPAGYVLQDLGSNGGTYVDGHQITQPVLLVPGQHIHIGDTDIVFQAASAPGAGIAQSRIQHWIAQQVHKRYWIFFLVGIAGYIIGALAVNASQNNHLVPLVALVGAAAVPVAFAVFCWEEGAFADMPPFIVGIVFVSGGIFGFLGACILESPLSNNTPLLLTVIVVGLAEESAKAAVAVWFLRDRRLRSELDGLVLGVAAGMGFAALETARVWPGLVLHECRDWSSEHHCSAGTSQQRHGSQGGDRRPCKWIAEHGDHAQLPHDHCPLRPRHVDRHAVRVHLARAGSTNLQDDKRRHHHIHSGSRTTRGLRRLHLRRAGRHALHPDTNQRCAVFLLPARSGNASQAWPTRASPASALDCDATVLLAAVQ
jgi:FHA domain/PrsW family intramembrane metalloprotease